MTAQDVLPDELDIWKRLAPRFMANLRAQHPALWRLSGLEKKEWPSEHCKGIYQPNEMVNEIAVFLTVAFLIDIAAQRKRSSRGRPRDVVTSELAPNLLRYFLRFNNLSGRHSVIVTVDGRKRQQEAGRLFEFFKAAIEPLNQYLIEIGRKPLSPARLARYALREHRRNSVCTIVANSTAGDADRRAGDKP